MKVWQFIIIIILIIIALLNPKLQLKKLFRSQFQVYKNDKNGKIFWFDIVTFFIIPILISIISAIYLPMITISKYSDTTITIFSLIATVLLSFVAILVDKKFKKENEKELLNETIVTIITNIIYSISIVALVVLPKIVLLSEIQKKIILGIIVFLIIKIAFGMFMILKRVYVIININTDNSNK